MEIIDGRMVHLGYGKYWRSDVIVGLSPILEDRGPGHRTEVYLEGRAEPAVASRSERAILRDMTVQQDEHYRIQEAFSTLDDLLDDLGDLSPVLRRMLQNEADFRVEDWEKRIRALFQEGPGEPTGQEDLFEPAD
jgi:hypothetical protein